jgi:hypothetical protein
LVVSEAVAPGDILSSSNALGLVDKQPRRPPQLVVVGVEGRRHDDKVKVLVKAPALPWSAWPPGQLEPTEAVLYGWTSVRTREEERS